MKTWKLEKTRQCAKCPWKVDTDPYEIPNGYSVELHMALMNTIANPGQLLESEEIRVMACHESAYKSAQEAAAHSYYCIGWLCNQLSTGNNLPLRIKCISCENINDIELVGDQHPDFWATLPREMKQ